MKDQNKFIAELHDIGKLVDHKKCKYMSSHYFNVEALGKDGLTVPGNRTFEGIQKHHCREKNPYCNDEKEILNDLDIVLLIMADHFASGFSRLDKKTEDKVKKQISAEDKSVYKLWNKGEQKDIKDKLIKCTKENIEAILDIVAKNDKKALFSNYKELLDIVPEDKTPLFNVISLKTHMTLVGKVYRFLRKQVKSFDNGKIEFWGDKPRTPKRIEDLENTLSFKLVFVSISMPKFIARVNDLALFKILDEQLNKLRHEDQILFVSSESFLSICGKDDKIEEIEFIKEFIDSGFKLKTKETIKPLSELVKLPQELIKEELKGRFENLEKLLKNEKIPENGKEKLKRTFIEDYNKFYHIYEPQRPKEIASLCDLCQRNEAIPYDRLTDEEKNLVTKEENGKKIIESLCKYCLNIRKEYEKSGNLKSFAKWENDIPRPDALWIKVSLDINNLVKALKISYNNYIDTVLKNNLDLAKEVKKQYKLRYTWISEFLYDYDRFLEEFYERSKESHEAIEINRDFFVAKKLENGQIKGVIDIYLELFYKYFPDLAGFKNDSPIRFSIVWTNVKSPLMWVVREINEVGKPISIILKNKDKLEVDVETMFYLNNELDLSGKNISSFLHKLTEMYEQSGLSLLPLTELFNERWKYEKLYEAISTKNLAIVNILDWYKISKE